jgi:integrase
MPRERKGAIITRGTAIYARVRFVDDFGKVKSVEKKADNRTHAKQILKELIRDLDVSGGKGLEARNLTFRQLAKDYESRKLIPAEYHGEGKNITKIAGLRSWKTPKGWLNTLTDYFRDKKVLNITHADIEDYKFKRLKQPTIHDTKRAISSVNRELELLRAIFRFAIQQRWLDHSPFEFGSPLISKADEIKRERILNFDEEERLLKVCTDSREVTYKRKGKEVTAKIGNNRELLKSINIVVIDTGMRKGELIKLRWRDINFTLQTITITALNSKTSKARDVGYDCESQRRARTSLEPFPKSR